MINLYNANNHNHTPPLKKNGSASKPDFTKYEEAKGEFGSKELKLGIWYVAHKLMLYKILVGVLMGVNIILWIFGLWRWGAYLLGIKDSQMLEKNLTSFINYTGMHAHYAPQPIQVLAAQIFASRENKYDAVAEMQNPDDRFLVKFDYYFVISGEKTPMRQTFLLPGETRPVAFLGLADAAGPASIVLDNISWQRVSAHKVPSTKEWQAYRLNFTVSDFVFLKSLAQEGPNADAIQFKLANNSPYSYVIPNFYVGLLQNGSMVGLLPLHLNSLNSLETKNIDLRSLAPGLDVTEIALYPIINIYDDSVYIMP